MNNLKSKIQNSKFASEFSQLRSSFMRILGVFVFVFLFFFAVPVSGYDLTNLSSSSSGETVSVWAIGKIQNDLLPSGASLVSLSPLDPFFAESSIAAALALLVTLPLIAFELWSFIAPALHRHEKRGIFRFFFISVILFFLGGLFSYSVLLPLVMQGLYTLIPSEVVPLYGLRSVISLVTGMMLATSLMFLLPAVMIILSRIGLVQPDFWRSYARHALFVSVVFSAIITPDGSGMSMVVLALPISVLYGLGCIGSAVSTEKDHLSANSINIH